MFNHAPEGYKCPICLGINGVENEDTLIRKSDIVYKDDKITAFISSYFIGNNPGHVIISPNDHFENIYDLPEDFYPEMLKVAKNVSLALKDAYKCDGITLLQNNEPEGGQHAFHYHLHVFPRYKNDNLHKNMMAKKESTQEERLNYANKIKDKLAKI